MWLLLAVFASVFVVEGVVTDAVTLVGKRHSTTIYKKDRPGDFAFVFGCYIAATLVGATFTFYQFRRGSWFNPI